MADKQFKFVKNKWDKVISDFPQIENLMQNIEAMYEHSQDVNDDEVKLKIFPEIQNIFRCFQYCDPENVKVVIIGQDPYHGEGQATGLCFGVNSHCKIPPSLRNINKEMISDMGYEISDITLEKWAKQGVLLINSALTVQEHCPASHAKIWKPFTEYILSYLNKNTVGVVFVAWGAFAYNCLFNKKTTLNTEMHYLIASSHPSPLSVNKQFKSFPKFSESKPFTKINQILCKLEKQPIKW